MGRVTGARGCTRRLAAVVAPRSAAQKRLGGNRVGFFVGFMISEMFITDIILPIFYLVTSPIVGTMYLVFIILSLPISIMILIYFYKRKHMFA